MKLATVEKKTFLAGLQCTLTSSCPKIPLSGIRYIGISLHPVCVKCGMGCVIFEGDSFTA